MSWLPRKVRPARAFCLPVLIHLGGAFFVAIWLLDCHLESERKRVLLRISSDWANDEVILRLEGEVTQPWTDELERMVAELFSEDKRVVLEMSAVRFIDAHAVEVLHKWSDSVVLRNCTPFLRELLKVRTLRCE
jgi:anti-anti-sigma regulatory factor